MTLLKGIEKIITGKNPPIDIWHYFVGNYRYKLYYAPVLYLKIGNHIQKLIRQHIREQIEYRIDAMKKECYHNGQCKYCGCPTTQLQMASKRCDGICYPTMMNKKEWERFKNGGTFADKGGVWIKRKDVLGLNLPTDKHIFYKETNNSYVPYNKD